MEQLTGLISAAQSGDPNVIKGAAISGTVTLAILLSNAVVKIAFKALKALAAKTKTKLDDEVIAAAEKDFKKKKAK